MVSSNATRTGEQKRSTRI